MRLDKNDTNIILSTVESIFGNVKVYLFGSRLDEQKKGGDIDLFIVSEEKSNLFEKKIKVISKLERTLHKPIDIVLHKNFEREINSDQKAELYFLDLLAHRPISNKIADDLGVTHQSPQLIVIENGKAINNASHQNISADQL